jgi:hypothetical protein
MTSPPKSIQSISLTHQPDVTIHTQHDVQIIRIDPSQLVRMQPKGQLTYEHISLAVCETTTAHQHHSADRRLRPHQRIRDGLKNKQKHNYQ